MRHHTSHLVALLLFTSVGSACISEEGEDGDGIDDSFAGDGKSDAFGVAEGSPDAIGVLSLVNSATLEQLDNDAGLASNAAKALIRHRQGADRKDGTEDDDLIDTLVELDAVPYVGPIAFRLLLDEARLTGHVPSADPFDANFCGSDFGVTTAGIRAALPPGATEAALPTTTAGIRVRSRVCVTPTDCPSWVAGPPARSMFVVDGTETEPGLAFPAAGVEAHAGIALTSDGRPVVLFEADVPLAAGGTGFFGIQSFPKEIPAADAAIVPDGYANTLDGKVLAMTGVDSGSTIRFGGRCTQIVIRRVVDQVFQREIVYFARY